MGEAQSKVHWQKDVNVVECNTCRTPFSLSVRRHHCRNCGYIFCANCCSYECTIPMRDLHKPMRVCHSCYQSLTGRVIRCTLTPTGGVAPPGSDSGKGRLLGGYRSISSSRAAGAAGKGSSSSSSGSSTISSKMTESVAARTSLLLRSGRMNALDLTAHGGVRRGKHDACMSNKGSSIIISDARAVSHRRDPVNDAFFRGPRTMSECRGADDVAGAADKSWESSCTQSAHRGWDGGASVATINGTDNTLTTQRCVLLSGQRGSAVHRDIYDWREDSAKRVSEAATHALSEQVAADGAGDHASHLTGAQTDDTGDTTHVVYAQQSGEDEFGEGGYHARNHSSTEEMSPLFADAHARWRDEETRLAQCWALVRQRTQFVDILVQRVERVEPDSVVEYSREVENITLQPEMTPAMAARSLLPLPLPDAKSDVLYRLGSKSVVPCGKCSREVHTALENGHTQSRGNSSAHHDCLCDGDSGRSRHARDDNNSNNSSSGWWRRNGELTAQVILEEESAKVLRRLQHITTHAVL